MAACTISVPPESQCSSKNHCLHLPFRVYVINSHCLFPTVIEHVGEYCGLQLRHWLEWRGSECCIAFRILQHERFDITNGLDSLCKFREKENARRAQTGCTSSLKKWKNFLRVITILMNLRRNSNNFGLRTNCIAIFPCF